MHDDIKNYATDETKLNFVISNACKVGPSSSPCTSAAQGTFNFSADWWKLSAPWLMRMLQYQGRNQRGGPDHNNDEYMYYWVIFIPQCFFNCVVLFNIHCAPEPSIALLACKVDIIIFCAPYLVAVIDFDPSYYLIDILSLCTGLLPVWSYTAAYPVLSIYVPSYYLAHILRSESGPYP